MTSLCSTFLICALITQDRFVLLGHWYVCATVFFSPLCFITLDIIAEVYGYQRARMALWIAIGATIIFTTIMSLTRILPAPAFWNSYDSAFDKSMHPLLRILTLDTIAVLAGQMVNIYLISKFKILTMGRFFALRSMFSSMFGDTAALIIAIVSIYIRSLGSNHILEIIALEASILYFLAFILAIPGSFIARILKKVEKSDPYDTGINFNPFIFESD